MADQPLTSWGLSPVGASSVSLGPAPQQPVMTPEMIAALRKQALSLQAPPTENYKSWTQGLAHLLNVIQGNREASAAMQQEAANRQAQSNALMGMLPQTGAPAANIPPTGAAGASPQASNDPSAYISRTFQLESGGDPNAVSPNGKNKGLAQFSPDLEAKYGITDANRADPHAQVNALLAEQKDQAPVLKAALGRDPTPGEQYLAHQQGIAGGPALLSANPSMPAWRVLRPFYKDDATAKSAVTGNLPKDSGLQGTNPDQVTAGQFAGYWKNKFERGMPQQPVPAPAPGPAPAGPAPMAFAGNPAPAASPIAPMINAIAGRPVPPPPGAPAPMSGAPPQQMAQNAPVPGAGAPAGGFRPLLPPQVSQQNIQAIINDPRVPFEQKMQAAQMYRQSLTPNDTKLEGGTVRVIPGTGQQQWIQEPVYKQFKAGDVDMTLEGNRTGPNEPMTWKAITPGSGATAQPGQAPTAGKFDFSTPEGAAAASASMAGAKKQAEAQGEGEAKYSQQLYSGYSGLATVAAQQKPNIDIVRQLIDDKDFKSGIGNQMDLAYRRALATFNVDPGAAAPREVFNQTMPRILADQFSGMKALAAETGETGARIFKPMLDIEEKSLPSPDDSPEGLRRKIDILDRVGTVQMQLGDAAADYKKEHGALDAGFEKIARGVISTSRIYGMGAKIPPAGETAPAKSPVSGKTSGGVTWSVQ